MSQSNFIVQDVVKHVYDEKEYRPRRIISTTIKRMVGKAWLYIIILALSGGVGYLAVYLPDAMKSQASAGNGLDAASFLNGAGPGGGNAMKDKLRGLSSEQKAALMEKYLGGQ
jgi:hypothetical protein